MENELTRGGLGLSVGGLEEEALKTAGNIETNIETRVMGKVSRRLLPLICTLYVVAYLDRINVGFAALQMNADLGISPAAFGLGSGIFFIGYFFFEIPSNLILARVGARRWIARILITWGIVASAMMFAVGEKSLCALRFLLGVAEAGFFPGMVLYLTYWFPQKYLARNVAYFMASIAIAGIVSGPVSGFLLTMHGLWGLAGWQWLFLLEGFPAVVLGFVVLFHLTDAPDQAAWLTADEKEWLLPVLEKEAAERRLNKEKDFAAAFKSSRVWSLCLIYFSIVIGMYGVAIWIPLIVKGMLKLSDLGVGLVSTFPYVAATLFMVAVGIRSDRLSERRFHLALPVLLAGASLVASSICGNPALGMILLCLIAAGIWGSLGPFWALSTSLLSGRGAAGGIALINSIGNLGGFAGPLVMGWVKDFTGSYSLGFLSLGVVLMSGSFFAAMLRSEKAGAAGDGAGEVAVPRGPA